MTLSLQDTESPESVDTGFRGALFRAQLGSHGNTPGAGGFSFLSTPLFQVHTAQVANIIITCVSNSFVTMSRFDFYY